jgi:squalene cyclase
MGASDAWTTSVVGVALARSAAKTAATALARARQAVAELRRPGGWGYNTLTPTDADSTAWAVRLLEAHDAPPVLTRYLDDEGCAHTFLNPRYGRWTESHPDVTPVVGLALLAARAQWEAVERVRAACLRSRTSDGTWRAFWWIADTYALARNLEFLTASGDIPQETVAAARSSLTAAGAPQTAFEAAQLVEIAHYVSTPSEDFTADLFSRQLSDGSWPASATLRQRAQKGEPEQPPFADERRLVSTASSLLAVLL